MTETARMYGGSLYDLAAEEGLETRILGELDEVQQLLKQNPDYLRLLSTPSIPKKERCGLLDEALRGQLHLYVLTEQQRAALHAKLESLTGKTIDLKTKVDAKVLGGIRLDIEGTELDGTVQNRLASLRRDIAAVTL